MKIIAPRESQLNYNSNIPEPDPASGEVEFEEITALTKPVNAPATTTSFCFESSAQKFYALDSGGDLNRNVSIYNTTLSPSGTGVIGSVSVDSSVTPPFDPADVIDCSAKSDATTDTVVFILNNSGTAYISTDAGVTFSQRLIDSGDNLQSVTNDGSAFYINAANKVYRSTDGLSWNLDATTTASRFQTSRLSYDGNFIVLYSFKGRAIRVGPASWTEDPFFGDWGAGDFALPQSLGEDEANGELTMAFSIGGTYELRVTDNSGASFQTLTFYPDIVRTMPINGDYYFVSSANTKVLKYSSSQGIEELPFNVADCYNIYKDDDFVFFAGSNSGATLNAADDSYSYFSDRLTSLCRINQYSTICTKSDSSNISYIPKTKKSISVKVDTANNLTESLFYAALTKQNSKTYIGVGFFSGSSGQLSVSSGYHYELLASEPSLEWGGACADNNNVYMLVKIDGSWTVQKIQLSNGSVTSVSFSAQQSTDIDNYNPTNPEMFIVNGTLNVPINSSLATGKFDGVLTVGFDLTIGATINMSNILEGDSIAATYKDDTVHWLLDSKQVEITDSVNFDPLTSYQVGDEVISKSTHKIYRAVTTTTNPPEVGLQIEPPEWVEVGPTNKYAMLETYVHNKTEGINANREIYATFDLNSEDSVCFFGMDNVSVIQVQVFDGAEVFNETYSMYDQTYSELTGQDEYFDSFCIVSQLPSGQLQITATSGDSNNPKIGRIVVGRASDVGITEYGTSIGIDDFSRRERNELGEFNILRRETAKNINFAVKIDKGSVNQAFRLLSSITTTPCVFIGDDNDASVQIYGFYSDYTNNIDQPTLTSGTISIEGLT